MVWYLLCIKREVVSNLKLTEMVYCELKEDTKTAPSWSKLTIDYVTNNVNKVRNIIRVIAIKSGKRLSEDDVDDIYMESICALYEKEEYDIALAINKSKREEAIPSIEGYIYSTVKNVIYKYLKEEERHSKNTVSESTYSEDGKEMSLYDKTPASRTRNEYTDELTLRDICKNCESHRYNYGIDMFQIMFIRLKTIQCDKIKNYLDILKVLGTSKSEMQVAEKAALTDVYMLALAKGVTEVDIPEAIDILKEFTYSWENLERVVEEF
jgi:excinuclease UvrABC ATPase subunit